jgi:hypothetical protein
MLTALLLGTITSLGCLAIQVLAVLLLLRHIKRTTKNRGPEITLGQDFWAVSRVMLGLFIGHMLQIAFWAKLFMWVGQFSDFTTAFYHSAVNFATLGYGDIVMDAPWNLLGALEAGGGVFMFGLSTGAMMAVLSHLYTSHSPLKPRHEKND